MSTIPKLNALLGAIPQSGWLSQKEFVNFGKNLNAFLQTIAPPTVTKQFNSIVANTVPGQSPLIENETVRLISFGNVVINHNNSINPPTQSALVRNNLIVGESHTYGTGITGLQNNLIGGINHVIGGTFANLAVRQNLLWGNQITLTDNNASSRNLSAIFAFGDRLTFNHGTGGSIAGFYMFSFGLDNIQTGFISSTIGNGLINNYSRSVVVGFKNIDRPAIFNKQQNWRWDNFPVFTVGNGALDFSLVTNRSDAFVVYSNATIEIGHARNSTAGQNILQDAVGANIGTMTNRLARLGSNLVWQNYQFTIPYGPTITVPTSEWDSFKLSYPAIASALSTNLGKRIVNNTFS